MSEIEDKILGKEMKEKPEAVKKNYFSSSCIWQVSKEGCGANLANGMMVYEMLSADGKKKALKGTRKIADKGFTFERRS